MVSTSQTLLCPLVDRDAVVSVYAPGRTPTEAPARTLRSHHTMSAGLSLRPRLTNRLAGQERMYSLVNLAAALLDRRGQEADARDAAEVAGVLEQWAKVHVGADDLLDYRVTGRTSNHNLFVLALTTSRLLEQLLSKVAGKTSVVGAKRDEMTGELTEHAQGMVLTYTVPVVRFTGDADAVASASLADALASLRLPGAFDFLRDRVDEAVLDGNVVKAPAEFRW